MKKTFKYLMALVAVVMMGLSFTACTNEDDVDLGAVGNWSVQCSKVAAPGKDDVWNKNIAAQLNTEICLADATGDDLNLTKLSQKSETQAKYYLDYAMETAYQYLNDADNAAFRKSLPEGTVITFTLYRVIKQEGKEASYLSSNTATLKVYKDRIETAQDFTFGEEEDK